MEDGSDFFGSVFDDPEDDPLLGGSSGGEEVSSESEPGPDPHDRGVPSWMSDDEADAGEADPGGTGPEQKEIVVVQRGESQQGLDELNEAVGEGWRLVQLSLAESDGGGAAARKEEQRFVAVLKQESPQSLFDFTGP
jgi:hypothetical protein